MPFDGYQVARPMLTGRQMAAARHLAGFRTQTDLAVAAGVGPSTVMRAEAEKDVLPTMNVRTMGAIVRTLEASGVRFSVPENGSLAGELGMRLVKPDPKTNPEV